MKIRSLALAALLLLAACGSTDEVLVDTSPTPLADPTTTKLPRTTAPGTPPVEDSVPGNTTAPTTPAAIGKAAKPETVGPTNFASPSRNIGCVISQNEKDAGEVRCNIAETTYPLEVPRAPDCENDYAPNSLTVDETARILCASDTVIGDNTTAVLAYGSYAQRGLVRCDSSTTGMTCRNLGTGKGFFLSRNAYRIF